jgi:hypothetical protein
METAPLRHRCTPFLGPDAGKCPEILGFPEQSALAWNFHLGVIKK